MPYPFTRLTLVIALLIEFAIAHKASEALTLALEPKIDRSSPVRLRELTDGTHAGDGSGRLFLVERLGRIRIFFPESGELLEEPFLQIADRVMTGGERGLLGLAFHPNFEENGRFFVYYSRDTRQSGIDHISVISEFRVSEETPNRALETSERVLMEIAQPERNHNAGQIKFGPDGMLYIALGDGGGSGDQHGTIGNGQDITTRLGSILRIDVDNGEPFAIPSDNPFVDQEGADEIWAFGLRNPWRFSFDRETGRLFCGDVGQNRLEEIDIIERGSNYGWRLMEATQCFNPARNCRRDELILPIAEYGRDQGFSVIGGFVYRGQRYPSLFGKYVFGDLGGAVFVIEETEENAWDFVDVTIEGESGNQISQQIFSFAEDESGEIYVLTGQGFVFLVTVPADENTKIEDWQEFTVQ